MHEKFNLKLNNFHTNITKSFCEIRKTSDFTDVTLVIDGEKPFLAHKLVLVSSSSFFSNILKQNFHSHPMIYLDGISSLDLKNILDYIYNGEVQIHQAALDRFLKVSEKFQLEGLLVQENSDAVEEFEFSSDGNQEEGTSMQETDESDSTKTQSALDSNVPLETNEPIAEEIEKYLDRTPEGNLCKLCGYQTGNKYFPKEHIETHFQGLSFVCNKCNKTFNKRATLRKHKSRGCSQVNKK